jgi:hypothetical protein|tara:strand:+ start:138 stop:1127 length:990 start_codon:yes stop_codon:yes gene_type:complete
MIDQKNMLETVSTMEMDYEDFIRLLEVPMQRNTEERLKTAKHLRVLRPEHCIVHLVRLTKDCTVKGKLYRKGTLMRVDSNTRAMTWEEGKSDAIPEKVLAIIYDLETMDEVKECYNCFDSSEATEKNQQKLYGIITGMYNYQPKSQRLTQGIILSGLNKACHFMYPDRWNQSSVKAQNLEGMVGPWIADGTLQALDEIMANTPKEGWNQPFIAAALMSLKYYGPNDPVLRSAWEDIIEERGNFKNANKDGVSHIIYEWMKGKFFKDVSICKDTKWENMNRTVSYILYWIDKYMEGEELQKVGGGWDNVAVEYKDRVSTSQMLNNVLSVA